MVEQVAQMVVHGEAWTVKDLFVLPNEYVYWSIQIVMYPYMTGLVAGAFVLSSLYHVFGVEKLREIARYALVFSFALLPVAMMPLLLHLMQPFRGIHVLMTPHFTSAISAFGIVFMTYACIVAAEIWFVYRKFIVESVHRLNNKQNRSGLERLLLPIYKIISLGAMDISEEALHSDHKAIKFLAGTRYSGCLLPAWLCRIYFRFGQSQCPLDDPAHAGYFHLFCGCFRYRALHRQLLHFHGDAQMGGKTRQKLVASRCPGSRRHSAFLSNSCAAFRSMKSK